MSTTAKVEYRDFVPYGYIAIEFCDISFYGDKYYELDNEWQTIKYKKLHEREKQIEDLNKNKVELNNNIKELQDKRNNTKCKFLFFKTQKEKDLDDQIWKLSRNIYSIDLKIDKLNHDKFYSAIDLEAKAEIFLEDHGFILDSSTSHGDRCATTTDIWKLNERKLK